MRKKINLQTENLSFHLVGVLGIGMSGLAQYLKWNGYNVSGSDRAINNPENNALCKKLTKLGVKLYLQNGSFADKEKVDYLVYSTAIEEGNPDFLAIEGLPRLHRTELLVELFNKMKDKTSIAVAGTCGKTSVSSLLSETFDRLGLNPFALVGGFINYFTTEKEPGNFKHGDGDWMIFETDESDKSLLSFHPNYSLLLNIGTDHYSEEELLKVFEKFLLNTKKGAVIEESLFRKLNPDCYKHLKTILFSTEEGGRGEESWIFDEYTVEKGVVKVEFKKGPFSMPFSMPVPGKYNVGNFLSALALFELLGLQKLIEIDKYIEAMSKFEGVHRRFEFIGNSLAKNLRIYSDFAHNVEKIESSIKCAKELTDGKVFAVFQAHGYKPFRFMADKLFPMLEKVLSGNDKFILLPVYYSGGSCSFEPKAIDVTENYRNQTAIENRYLYFETKNEAEAFIRSESSDNDIVLIMGARDNSLPIWAGELVQGL